MMSLFFLTLPSHQSMCLNLSIFKQRYKVKNQILEARPVVTSCVYIYIHTLHIPLPTPTQSFSAIHSNQVKFRGKWVHCAIPQHSHSAHSAPSEPALSFPEEALEQRCDRSCGGCSPSLGPGALDGTRAFSSSELVQPFAHPLFQIQAPEF